MPAQLTYPGVYIEEVPSGVRTITGVATSITAFVGRAARGPVDDPVTLTSFADFERRFGGLWRLSALGFAVRDFFQNGGGQAIIVRLYRDGPDDAHATIDANGLALRAASPGSWGNALRARSRRARPSSRRTSPRSGRRSSRHHDERPLQPHRPRHGDRRDGGVPQRHRRGQPAPDRDAAREPVAARRLRRDADVPDVSDGTPDPGEDVWADDTLLVARRHRGLATASSSRRRRSPAPGSEAAKEGLFALENADLFNLLVIPPYDDGDVDDTLVGERGGVLRAAPRDADRRPALGLGRRRRRASTDVDAVGTTQQERGALLPAHPSAEPALPRPDRELRARRAPSPASSPAPTRSAASGRRRPASTRRSSASPELSVPLTDGEIGQLNPLGVNCLRSAARRRPRRLGRADAAGQRPARLGVEVRPGAAHGALPRGEPLPRHAVGRVRAERRAAVGADPAQRRRVHEQPVPPGRVRRARRRARRTSSSATPRRRPRTTSTSASSTSSSASRRSSRPSSS